MLASYIPQLEHGNWLNKSSQISEIPAVISKEANELKIGDVVELTSLFEDTNSLSDIPLKVRIVGELAEGARIPGYQIGNEININDTPIIAVKLGSLYNPYNKGVYLFPTIPTYRIPRKSSMLFFITNILIFARYK